MQIEIAGLSKRFGTTPVLDRIDLTIPEREFLGLLGPSGSGKTTLLRILAGLEFADNGRLRFDGRDAQALPIEQRQVGLVFQHYALFGHMTVFNNIAFGLQVRPRATRPSRRDIAARVESLLKLVQLEGIGFAFSAAALGRAASAGRIGAGARDRAEAVAARRAVRGARRQGACRNAPLAAGIA